mmetsp:Transcript_8875/g.13649  ORF Transcript_8875/g.13649 Transcript_8875/m.13649 type:complete len:166 (+) Transcript_8875:104-601(+)|eukprot:CAMPEP_0178914236 /NCGR_PEP_ID=MMETSP0786-20121207/11311_1 /TAXON_ID=186022 /ORGANISM="Thalassionema frauenfeldii, Strain CCMP 1798" /LENGTH=165 /DNA_ID=CAMNT_0020587117 /DNA_START=41 /DNA_END=538 /DNA_ORIENTATION=+
MILEMRRSCFAIVALIISCSQMIEESQGFVINSKQLSHGQQQQQRLLTLETVQKKQQSTSVLFESNNDNYNGPNKAVDGTGRGVILQGFVFLVTLWMFSIPPEFRRSYFCGSPRCEANRSLCHNCVTGKEWVDGVTEYYKNGGGVQFDFTISEETKALWNNQGNK